MDNDFKLTTKEIVDQLFSTVIKRYNKEILKLEDSNNKVELQENQNETKVSTKHHMETNGTESSLEDEARLNNNKRKTDEVSKKKDLTQEKSKQKRENDNSRENQIQNKIIINSIQEDKEKNNQSKNENAKLPVLEKQEKVIVKKNKYIIKDSKKEMDVKVNYQTEEVKKEELQNNNFEGNQISKMTLSPGEAPISSRSQLSRNTRQSNLEKKEHLNTYNKLSYDLLKRRNLDKSNKSASRQRKLLHKRNFSNLDNSSFSSLYKSKSRNTIFMSQYKMPGIVRMNDRPETIYMKEVEEVKRQIKKNKQRAIDEGYLNKIYQKKNQLILGNCNSLEEIPQLLKRKEKKMMKLLSNPKNPYSIEWEKKYLKNSCNCTLKVDGFLNGIPKFKVVNLDNNKQPNFLFEGIKREINGFSTEDNSGNAYPQLSNRNYKRREENETISFPLLYKYFKK